jgi:hypothetical protein
MTIGIRDYQESGIYTHSHRGPSPRLVRWLATLFGVTA